MSVDLEPVELGFKRPFTHEVSQVLRLSNPHAEPVAFKVKTTAPKQYCVRPNSGRIEPGKNVEVQVLLQAMKEDPPLDARCRDKFLVQSVAIAPDADTSAGVTAVWQSIEQTAKSSIQEKKIRVVFLPASGAAAPANGLLSSTHEDEPPAYSSPGPAPVTPQRGTPAPEKSSSLRNETPATSSALSSATAAVASVTGISQADLERQLAEAKATIAKLQTQAAEQTGLRQRKPDEKSVTGSTTTLQQQAPPAGGVPVQLVALLCLLSFIIAYLLF